VIFAFAEAGGFSCNKTKLLVSRCYKVVCLETVGLSL